MGGGQLDKRAAGAGAAGWKNSAPPSDSFQRRASELGKTSFSWELLFPARQLLPGEYLIPVVPTGENCMRIQGLGGAGVGRGGGGGRRLV